MSPLSISPGLAAVRTHAQLFVEHADDHAGQLDALVAAARNDVRHAEAAVSHAADHDVDGDEVRRLLGAQLARARRSCRRPGSSSGLPAMAWRR